MPVIQDLKLEIGDGVDPTRMGHVTPGIMMTPDIGEDYFDFRVRLNDTGQAILGFPKFGTVGIGFAQEENWNTNLPYTCETDRIFEHIKRNKGDGSIPDEAVRRAIEMVQEAARRYQGDRT